MVKFSTPELKVQADELMSQIISGLSTIGVKAEINKDLNGIKIPEYQYNIAYITELMYGDQWSLSSSGTLKVLFGSVFLYGDCLCRAKSFKGGARDLVKKVVASIKERRDVIVARQELREIEEKARKSHEEVLRGLSKDFPSLKKHIEYHKSKINLNFNDLSEDQAQLILTILQNAGFDGNK
jgi:hypothetical protein